jgi:hypothetical protein
MENALKKTWSVFQDGRGSLVLRDAQGGEQVGVEPVRAFPITAPDSFISLRDPLGKELWCIASLEELSQGERALIEKALSEREFMPLIQRIHRLTCEVPPLEWEVETDRGRTQFLISSADNIRRLGSHRLLVVDVNGIRYQIQDYMKLDVQSRRLLERVL